jgi:NAD(P)-dependent dehydrogenase (short-subunit alcohol dehydrogenase family)
MEGVSQALSQELSPFGIRILLVELGASRTSFLEGTLQTVGPTPSYASPHPVGLSLEEEQRKNGTEPGDPEKAVRRIFEVVTGTGDGAGKTHHLRLPLGQDSWEAYGQQAKAVSADLDAFKDMAFSVGFD